MNKTEKREKREKTQTRIYIICPVRKLAKYPEIEKLITGYVERLEESGYLVSCPFRDTKQDVQIGISIVRSHEQDIIWADQVHIFCYPSISTGWLWDYGQTRMARYSDAKKIILVNEDDIKIVRDENGEIKKDYINVLLCDHFGITTENPKLLHKAKRAAEKRRKRGQFTETEKLYYKSLMVARRLRIGDKEAYEKEQ